MTGGSQVDPHPAMTALVGETVVNADSAWAALCEEHGAEHVWATAKDTLFELGFKAGARVAVVRPTRDDVRRVICEAMYQSAGFLHEWEPVIVQALIEAGFVAVSDSQETPTL